MAKKNTPELWDDFWKLEATIKEKDQYNLLKEEKSIKFQRIEKIIHSRFKDLNGLKVIEIGAGTGLDAALLAKRGATITVLDYSEQALQHSKDFFANNNLKAEFICANALDIPEGLYEQYDIAMSFGLNEHFLGDERLLINKSHFDLIKKGGVAFISVPNRLNFPYRIFKFTAETLGVWNVGEEYPYTRKELRHICNNYGIENYMFIGDSIYSSFNFISPFRVLRKIFNIKPSFDHQKIKMEKGSPLDEYFSYALVLCAFKD